MWLLYQSSSYMVASHSNDSKWDRTTLGEKLNDKESRQTSPNIENKDESFIWEFAYRMIQISCINVLNIFQYLAQVLVFPELCSFPWFDPSFDAKIIYAALSIKHWLRQLGQHNPKDILFCYCSNFYNYVATLLSKCLVDQMSGVKEKKNESDSLFCSVEDETKSKITLAKSRRRIHSLKQY